MSLNFVYANTFKNDLQYETSPYLKQHETNPVHWMPWGKKAFAKAKREHKPLYLSIGYSTCYWCHVMAEESFINPQIAQLLNKYFISVKVDIEELPQVDAYYQNIYKKAYHHSAGWPLNVFVDTNKEPFFISSYLPPKREPFSEGLDTLVPRYGKLYQTNASAITQEIKKLKIFNEETKKSELTITLDMLSHSLKEQYNQDNPGFGTTKQFPQAAKLSLMMDLGFLQNDTQLVEDSYAVLDMMALRGLYDHIEGGFFRYASDSAWEIAHFEKMLYNQAELLPLYTRAYLKIKKPLYKKVILETVAMLEDRFETDDLYYSASDTGEHHKEGEYFIFTQKQVEDAIAKNPYPEVIEDSLEFVTAGNFHSKVHINFYTQQRPKGFKEFRAELLKIRKQKKYPFIDKKINTAWNAMMIEALYKVSLVDKTLQVKAEKHLKALKDLMFDRGELYHQTIMGVKAKQKAILEDYSYFIAALIAGYEVDYNKDKLHFANYLLARAKEKFYKSGVWYLSDDGMHVEAQLNDKYYTSPLSKMLQNIIKLASLEGSFKYEKLALESLKHIKPRLKKELSNIPAAATAFMMQKLGFVTLKSNQENLHKNAIKIKNINYPYILTKKIEDSDYLSCNMRRCFSKEKEFASVLKAIQCNQLEE